MVNLKPIERVLCILSGAILGALLMTGLFDIYLDSLKPDPQIEELKAKNVDLENQLNRCQDNQINNN